MHKQKQRGFSLVELLIVVAVILVLAALATTHFMRARIAANEASAVSSMRTITNAQISYGIVYCQGYADDLSKLGPAAVPSAAKADTLDGQLASGVKQGYVFKITSATKEDFRIDAIPMAPGSTGVRNFCSDQSGIIHASDNGDACDLTKNSLQ